MGAEAALCVSSAAVARSAGAASAHMVAAPGTPPSVATTRQNVA